MIIYSMDMKKGSVYPAKCDCGCQKFHVGMGDDGEILITCVNCGKYVNIKDITVPIKF